MRSTTEVSFFFNVRFDAGHCKLANSATNDDESTTNSKTESESTYIIIMYDIL